MKSGESNGQCFDDLGGDFADTMDLMGFMEAHSNFNNSHDFSALMSTISGEDWAAAANMLSNISDIIPGGTSGGPVGWQIIGDWNGDGIWDIEQSNQVSGEALAIWAYGAALVQIGVDPITGQVFDDDLYQNHLFEVAVYEDSQQEHEYMTITINGFEVSIPLNVTAPENHWPTNTPPEQDH